MDPGSLSFDRFVLDPHDRQLRRDDIPVELSSRYFDALALLVREQGKLVGKQRFLEEVWRGVPVTDEALTQCIKTLRRQLGDKAASPRFIETVPKHGYRFIAPVSSGHAPAPRKLVASLSPPSHWRQFLLLGGAGTIGSGVAGIFGGLFYGFATASPQLQPNGGAVSMLLVLLCLNILVAMIGGAGVSFGIAAAGLVPGGNRWWSIFGGALGGLVVGALVKLLGLDAFDLLLGRSPGDITGAAEGALLGGAVGLGVLISNRSARLGRGMFLGAVAGGVAGLLIPLLGGRLMGGSLDLLASRFPDSRLQLDRIGGLFGESGFGPVSQVVTGGLEGALFAGCIVGAMMVARRASSRTDEADRS